MEITERDLDLFRLISTCALLTTQQIRDRVFRKVAVTTVLRRLRKLEKEKWIERVIGLPGQEVAWCLTLKGGNAVGDLRIKRHFHRLNLVHDVKINDIRFALEDCGISRSWIPEHEIRSEMAKRHGLREMKRRSVPDGIMGFRYQEVMESVAVELELHYKSKDRYENIFCSYAEKKNIKAIWYLVLTKNHGEHLARIWKATNGQRGPWLFWSLVSDVEKKGAKAVMKYFDDQYLVENIFEPSIISHPAHMSGSEVGRQNAENIENKNVVSIEKEKELTPKAS